MARWKACHDKYVNDNNTFKDSVSFPLVSTVAVQHEDGGPWMHAVIEEANKSDHCGRSYIIRVMKTGRLVMWNTTHICNTPITMEQCHQEQIKKELDN